MSGSISAWERVGIAAGASVLGSTMIYVDVIYNRISKKDWSILKSSRFFGASLSVSCGTLTLTALNAILPESVEYMLDGRPQLSTKHANGLVVPFFIIGVLLCQFMNFLVLRFASRSAVACAHDLDNATRPVKSPEEEANERTALLHNHSHSHDPERGAEPSSSNALNSDDLHATAQQLNPAGYTSAPFPVDPERAHAHEDNILHLKSARSADLLAIGVQTTLGISIHRVPEGLLLFAASQADRDLGMSIVLSLTIHSFAEGFSIAAPLYGALENRGLVVLISALLGCGPQVVGAAIGSYIFHGDNGLTDDSKFIFGLCMAATSGFMLIVSTQMIGSAYRYMSQTAVLYGVVFGVLLSLSARAI